MGRWFILYHKKMKHFGLTMIELIVVMIVLGILATLTLPMFGKTLERAKDKEAITNLKLIQAAEKIYRLERDTYYPNLIAGVDVAAINSNLTLELNDRYWVHTLRCNNLDSVSGICHDYDALLSRGGDYSRTWRINSTLSEPQCSPSENCPK